jgi:hypothetical protein
VIKHFVIKNTAVVALDLKALRYRHKKSLPIFAIRIANFRTAEMDVDESDRADAILRATAAANRAAVGPEDLRGAAATAAEDEDAAGRPSDQNNWSEGDEEATFAVFHELLAHLPEKMKFNLLLKSLKSCGPACLEGIEEARDAILYSASRRNPALLKNIVSWVEEGGAGAGGDGDEEDEEDDEEIEGNDAGDDEDNGAQYAPSSSSSAAANGSAATSGGWAKGFLNNNRGLGVAGGSSSSAAVPAAAGNGVGGGGGMILPKPGSDEDMQLFLRTMMAAGGAAAASSSSSSGSGAPPPLPAGFFGGSGSSANATGMTLEQQRQYYLSGATQEQKAQLGAALQGYRQATALGASGADMLLGEDGFPLSSSSSSSKAAPPPKPELPPFDDEDEDEKGFGL